MDIKKSSSLHRLMATASVAGIILLNSTSLHAGQGFGFGYSPGYGSGYGPGYGPMYGPGYGYQRPPMPPRYRPTPPRYRMAPPPYRYDARTPRTGRYGNNAQSPDTAAGSRSSEEVATNTGNTVSIASMQFQPATLRIKTGEKVTWTNRGKIPHTVTGDNNPLLDSTRLGQGNVFEQVFDEPGNYNYYCALHPSMKGTVIVE